MTGLRATLQTEPRPTRTSRPRPPRTAPAPAAQILVPPAPSPHAGYAFGKRAMDLAGSLVLLVILSPVLLGIAAAVRFTSRGPVFYRQERCGLGGAPIIMTKFRSMSVDADERLAELQAMADRGEIDAVDAPAFKSEHDPRVTRVGKYLRRYSLDELPQLIDVLNGRMSLVGPRPIVFSEALQLPQASRQRHSVKPGITCIWQTSGRSRLPYDVRMRMDVEYVERRSLWLDVVLLAKTPAAVISGDGAC